MEVNELYDYPSKKLTLSFYQKTETLQIARMLLGKHLFTFFEGQLTGGLIIETEA